MNYVGRIGIAGQRGANLAIQNCDFLLALGSHLSIQLTGTFLEAFALGKPVIGANLGGIPELVQDSKTGYLFPPGDSKALKQLILANMVI